MDNFGYLFCLDNVYEKTLDFSSLSVQKKTENVFHVHNKIFAFYLS